MTYTITIPQFTIAHIVIGYILFSYVFFGIYIRLNKEWFLLRVENVDLIFFYVFPPLSVAIYFTIRFFIYILLSFVLL